MSNQVIIKDIFIRTPEDFIETIHKHNIHINKDCTYTLNCIIHLDTELLSNNLSEVFEFDVDFIINNSYFHEELLYIRTVFNNYDTIRSMINSNCIFNVSRNIMTSSKIKSAIKVYDRFKEAFNTEPLLTYDELSLIIDDCKNRLVSNKIRLENLHFIKIKSNHSRNKHSSIEYYIRLPDITFSIYDASAERFPKLLLQYLSVNKNIVKKVNIAKEQALTNL